MDSCIEGRDIVQVAGELESRGAINQIDLSYVISEIRVNHFALAELIVDKWDDERQRGKFIVKPTNACSMGEFLAFCFRHNEHSEALEHTALNLVGSFGDHVQEHLACLIVWDEMPERRHSEF